MRLLWQRLTESPDARLNRIREIGYVRFAASYALIFPLCHLLAFAVRAALTRSLAGQESLPVELAQWSIAGGGVATLFWLGMALRPRRRTEKVDSRSP